ncbi:MAG TPA: glycosyltransferase [Methylomirabilota bacterium]|nr:glycosyltransferase [Methylomirabilota bacterium]
MRVALVHDWLTGMRGGERCLEAFCELFPDADLYTLLHVPGSVSPIIEKRPIVTSFVQHLPSAETSYRLYLPFFPVAIGRFDFSGYDLVLSTSHCVAKGARARAGAIHVCYCFTPMRYVWDRYDDYFGQSSALARALARPVAAALRRWDRASSGRVHHFVAISHYVADRIQQYYGRRADVIHPPVDAQRFRLAEETDRGYYLVVSALVPYKRVDLAVEAANTMGFRLLIVGTGPEESSLKKLAGRTVEFLGWQSDAEVAELYTQCRAVLFPGVEDFGIVPLEAMASGRPVIAFRGGGALETIVPLEAVDEAPTGVFFEPQTIEALIAAVRRFESCDDKFVPKLLRARAEMFDKPRFRERVKSYLEARLETQLC